MGNQIDLENVETDNASLNFPDGENPNAAEATAELNPQDVAEEVLRHRGDSVRGDVLASVAICTGYTNFRDDTKKLAAFIAELVDKKVLKKKELNQAGEPKSDSFISKAKKVNEHKDRLLHPKIAPYLPSGITVIYEVAKLLDYLEGDEDQRIDELQTIIKQHDGPLERAYLETERQRRSSKPARKKTKKEETKLVALPASPSMIPDSDMRVSDTPSDGSATATEEFEDNTEAATVVLVAVPDSVSALVEERGSGLYRPQWQKEIDSAKSDAIVILYGKLNAIFAMTALIGREYDKPWKIVVRKEVAGDITTVDAIAIFEHGGSRVNRRFKDWQRKCSTFELVTAFLDEPPGRKVHLFTDGACDGWESIPKASATKTE
jgi:hypothetical protein